jgi:HD-GYP domain-containing protein (c-di-GMP phosphodiesterase class II)
MNSSAKYPSLWERIKNVFSPRPVGEQLIPIDPLRMTKDDLALAYDATLEAWARMLELRKLGTEGHLRRVTEMTVALARQMGMTEEEIVHVRRGAFLHDIGEMGVPDTILLKDGPLIASERIIMRRHPQYAYDMLSPIEYLRPALAIPYCHHEKWDGMGYPRGLKGEEIPLAARIFAVVDTWDALRTDRPYRKAWSEEETLHFLNQQADKEFDPAVVNAFVALRAAPK